MATTTMCETEAPDSLVQQEELKVPKDVIGAKTMSRIYHCAFGGFIGMCFLR
jgi:hypothetical protein